MGDALLHALGRALRVAAAAAALAGAAVTRAGDSPAATADVVRAQPAPAAQRFVLAHWMVGMGRWDAGNPRRASSDYEAVLREAKEMGVDAVVVYWDNYSAAREHFAAALDAAEEVGAKLAWGCMGANDDDWFELLMKTHARPGLFRDAQGRIVVSGFYMSPPIHAAVQRARAAGVAIAYYPDLPGADDSPREQRAAAMGAQGLFRFYPGVRTRFGGGVFGMDEYLESCEETLAACQRHGIAFVPPILPFYAGVPGRNWQVFETYGFEGVRAQWMWAIEHREIPAVQLVTVNDYNERSYLQTFGDGGPLVGVGRREFWVFRQPAPAVNTPAVLDHSGFAKFMRRYAEWFKTGAEPRIARDEFLLAYRLHPRDAKSFGELSEAEQKQLREQLPPFDGWRDYATRIYQRMDSYDVLSDSIQLCARLAAPATVELSCGESRLERELPAGEHILTIPGARSNWGRFTFTPAQFGKPAVRVTRGGAVVFRGEGALPITPYIAPGDYNYFAEEVTPAK